MSCPYPARLGGSSAFLDAVRASNHSHDGTCQVSRLAESLHARGATVAAILALVSGGENSPTFFLLIATPAGNVIAGNRRFVQSLASP